MFISNIQIERTFKCYNYKIENRNPDFIDQVNNQYIRDKYSIKYLCYTDKCYINY